MSKREVDYTWLGRHRLLAVVMVCLSFPLYLSYEMFGAVEQGVEAWDEDRKLAWERWSTRDRA